MFCKKCGSQIEEGTGFCKKCGTAVEQTGVQLLKPFKIVVGILILQVLQLIFYFVHVFVASVPELDLIEYCNVREVQQEFMEFDPTILIAVCSLAAIIATVLLLLKIEKGIVIGHILRFIGWFAITGSFIGTWLSLKDFHKEELSYFAVSFKLGNSFWGVLLHLINIVLFAALILLVRSMNKMKSDICGNA